MSYITHKELSALVELINVLRITYCVFHIGDFKSYNYLLLK